MAIRSMADAVRSILVKRAFVPGSSMGGDPAATGGMPPPGMDPAAMGGMPPPGMDPVAMGGMPPPGMDPAATGGMPPGVDPAMLGGDPMAGMPPVDPAMAGAVPPPAGPSSMINMTADEFTKFIKQMMAAFGANGQAAAQQAPAQDIGAKLDTLIAVMQANGSKPCAPVV